MTSTLFEALRVVIFMPLGTVMTATRNPAIAETWQLGIGEIAWTIETAPHLSMVALAAPNHHLHQPIKQTGNKGFARIRLLSL